MINHNYDFNLKDKVVVITGGSGIICSIMAQVLASYGAKTAILELSYDKAEQTALTIRNTTGNHCVGIAADVTNRDALETARTEIHRQLGKIDFLINGAGGNESSAIVKAEMVTEGTNMEDTFFGINLQGFQKVLNLNFMGSLIPSLVFATDMLEKGKGCIVNISSMSAQRPLTKVPAYSASKAAIDNFTRWLAVHFAQTGIRVNAIAPGFLLTSQNRLLLTDEKTGGLTLRGEKIIKNTPMGRFGIPEELCGALLYLLSDLSAFVTGAIIPVDGGFSAYSGV